MAIQLLPACLEKVVVNGQRWGQEQSRGTVVIRCKLGLYQRHLNPWRLLASTSLHALHNSSDTGCSTALRRACVLNRWHRREERKRMDITKVIWQDQNKGEARAQPSCLPYPLAAAHQAGTCSHAHHTAGFWISCSVMSTSGQSSKQICVTDHSNDLKQKGTELYYRLQFYWARGEM